MIIEIASKNMNLTGGSRKLVSAYNLALKRYFKRIYSIRWSFESVRRSVQARLLVHAYSGQYRVRTDGTTLREVVITACEAVEKQRRRRKRILERARRQQTVRQSSSAGRPGRRSGQTDLEEIE